MKKTLLILAAGMGSRYGGLKQIDGVGPHGEFLIEYSVYDAIQAGFDKIVFVIKRDFASAFKKHFAPSKYKQKVKFEYAYQDLNDLPRGFKLPSERQKPWGTGHAVLAARNFIKEPFAVISADDFYGREAFKIMAKYLSQIGKTSQNHYAVVGYRLGNTLSEHGWVARGLCRVDKDFNLTSIYEHTKVGWLGKKIVSQDKKGKNHPLSPDRLVSMVMFGFTPDFFAHLQTAFIAFLTARLKEPDIEFFTPNVVNDLIQSGVATMKVLPTDSQWFGMTYHQDKAKTVAAIKKLIADGVYPESLTATD